MQVSRFLMDTRITLVNIFRNEGWLGLWEKVFLPVGLPLLLGVGMSGVLAKFVVDSDWALVFSLLLILPAVILFLTYPFAAILVWIVLMPFLQTTETTTYRTIFWLIHRVMPLGVLGIFFLSSMLGLSKRQKPVRLGLVELAMGLFVGLAMLSIFTLQREPAQYIYHLYDRVIVPMCFYLLCRLIAPSSRDLERLLPIALFVVLVESGVSVLSQFAPQLLPSAWLRLLGARGTGTLDNPYAYSISLVIFSFLLYHGAMHRKPNLVRTLYLLAFCLSILGIFLSFSRGTWVGALVASLGLLALYPKTTIKLVSVFLVIMVILGVSVLSEQVVWARERLASEDTAKDRLVIWDAGLQMIEAKPLFGWGYGDYSLYAGRFQRRVQNYVAAKSHASHNALMTVAAELGIPALFLFLFPVLYWLRQSYKAMPRMPKTGFWSQLLLLILWLTLIDHVIVVMFTDLWHSTYAQGLWWIRLGLIANLINDYQYAKDTFVTVGGA